MEIAWRAPFRSSEVNALHAACFETRLYSDDEWDWNRLCERHSLGWASARTDDVLVGFDVPATTADVKLDVDLTVALQRE